MDLTDYFRVVRILIHASLIFSAFIGFAHEGHQAFYKLTIENGALVLTSKLEIPDVQTALEQTGFCKTDQDFNWCAGTWVAERISVSIDGEIHALMLEATVVEDGHLILTHSLGLAPSKMESIAVRNTAFLETFPDYENIFQTSLENNSNGFKMTNERTNVSINLDQ